MRSTRRFLFPLLGTFTAAAAAVRTATAQTIKDPTKLNQGPQNSARCPVCKTPVPFTPAFILITGKNGVIDGSTINAPALVCPNDGVIFCVHP